MATSFQACRPTHKAHRLTTDSRLTSMIAGGEPLCGGVSIVMGPTCYLVVAIAQLARTLGCWASALTSLTVFRTATSGPQ